MARRKSASFGEVIAGFVIIWIIGFVIIGLVWLVIQKFYVFLIALVCVMLYLLASYFKQKESYFKQKENDRKNAYLWQESQFWWSLDGREFEQEVAKIFRQNGYKTNVTKASGDGGVDIILQKDSKTSIVQCKHHKRPIHPEPIRALWGCKDDFGADEVILIASSGITKAGRDFVRNKPNFRIMTLNDIILMSPKAQDDIAQQPSSPKGYLNFLFDFIFFCAYCHTGLSVITFLVIMFSTISFFKTDFSNENLKSSQTQIQVSNENLKSPQTQIQTLKLSAKGDINFRQSPNGKVLFVIKRDRFDKITIRKIDDKFYGEDGKWLKVHFIDQEQNLSVVGYIHSSLIDPQSM